MENAGIGIDDSSPFKAVWSQFLSVYLRAAPSVFLFHFMTVPLSQLAIFYGDEEMSRQA